jgi:hypothetical protein
VLDINESPHFPAFFDARSDIPSASMWYDPAQSARDRGQMKRRQFLAVAGRALVGLNRAARAQQAAMPVVGFLNPASPDTRGELIAAFHQGLAEAGYVERRNVAVEYRWAKGRNDRLPVMAADLVQRRVAVISVRPSSPTLTPPRVTGGG